jgi:polysaccharide export outer membrane protein
MKYLLKFFLIVFMLTYILGSCGINSNVLFKSPKGEYAMLDSLPVKANESAIYRIGVDDKVMFSLSTNNGTKLIEKLSAVGTEGSGGSGFSPEYLVGRDSLVRLPVLGKVKLGGLTIPEAEIKLAESFSKTYQNPFVQVKVTNQRVIVFPGSGGEAQVIILQNNNTTLMEVIALAGGITDRGKAKTVKLIRKENEQRKVYTIDLSIVDGLKYADVIVQANDYIYIEPKPELIKRVSKELAPVLSLFSTILLFATLIFTR